MRDRDLGTGTDLERHRLSGEMGIERLDQPRDRADVVGWRQLTCGVATRLCVPVAIAARAIATEPSIVSCPSSIPGST